MFAAHSTNSSGVRHDLAKHLASVAERTSEFATALGAATAGYYLGLWHDLGKFHPAFQQYLAKCEASSPPNARGPDHKAVGAWLAQQYGGLLALVIQAHHGGLRTPQEFRSWLADQDVNQLQRIKETARSVLGKLEPPEQELPLPARAEEDPLAAELFLRLLFSALVDADFLDTEAHFQKERHSQRQTNAGLAELRSRLAHSQDVLSGHRNDPVGVARHLIYEACLHAADQPPGLFRLTVPTGGGKTRSVLAFALRHAMQYGHRRIIVAVPYISITEQTAAVYRDILEDDTCQQPVVLEHHSGVYARENSDDADQRAVWLRLAAENWDALVIVTTTIQLFESLFAHTPGRCRKLHRLARSVIILDEAQTLPPHLLAPCLDVLQELCVNYGSTVVLSTATQPAFEAIPAFRGIEAREIVPEPDQFFSTLKRVDYEWALDPPLPWSEVAALLEESPQSLAVVNTKADALALLDALHDPGALHLSTLLCGAHRRNVITEVKRRLEAGDRCRLVSTQVVEAGVDLDFPLVARALGPLDGIIQAAGRCNREGRLARGRVIVFQPREGRVPPGFYRTATGITGALLSQARIDLDDPELSQQYFARLYNTVETDRDQIQALRTSFDYPEVARRFSMISQNTEAVVITTYGSPDMRSRVQALVRELRRGSPRGRTALRLLQPFLVTLPERTVDLCRSRGLVDPICAGLGEWLGTYDPIRGVVLEDPGALIV